MFCYSFAATITGYVRDETTGEPLAYANVVLVNTKMGSATDVHGYFILTQIPEGSYILKAMMIGFNPLEYEIDISTANVRQDFQLRPSILKSETVTVSAERMRFEKKVDISRVNLTNRDIRKAPAFFEADVFRTIQLLPSVSASNDFNAALIVRGGSPDENLILIDGAEIYNPYHIGGVFSTFNSEMIADSEFLAGGFPSQYGGRLSSVLNITSREGDSKNGRLSPSNPIKKYVDFSKAKGDISLLSSKILAEGPLYNGSWIISGRRTYFDQFVNIYYNMQGDEAPFIYYFWDAHLKAKSSITKNHQLTYSQFSGRDDLFISLGGDDFPGIDFSWDWGNSTKSLQWKFIPAANYFFETNLSKTEYRFYVDFSVDFVSSSDTTDESYESSVSSEDDVDLSFDVDNLVEDITLHHSFNYIYSEKFKLKAGIEIKSMYLNYLEHFSGIERANLKSRPQINTVFVNSTWRPFPLLHLNTGIRISDYNLYSQKLVDPRISLKFNPTVDLALKASWGKFSQFLFTINQEDELLRIVDFWQPIPKGEKPQVSEHFILGCEYWISEGNTFSSEIYYKPYLNLYDLNPKVDGVDIEGTLALPGTGKAYGIEFLYRLKLGKASGWVSYAYSKIKRTVDLNSDDVIWESKEIYDAKYDKPHSFNVVLSYNLNKKYDAGFSCVFGSGNTYTPVIGKVHQAGTQFYGSLENPYQYFGNVFGARNSGRYPNYFRMDISLSRNSNTFGLDSKWKFQIINLTNNYNVLLYNWNHNASPSQVKAYSMFPLIFTFGWEFNI